MCFSKLRKLVSFRTKKRPKYEFKAAHAFFLAVILLIAYLSLTKSNDENKIPVQINNTTINAEVAVNNKERSLGLMFRRNLAQNDGMLFIFDNESRRSFWMKNTKIPLDIIWVNKDKKIVHIEHSALPCLESPCLSYSSKYPVMYVLEVNGGWSIENGTGVGDTVNF